MLIGQMRLNQKANITNAENFKFLDNAIQEEFLDLCDEIDDYMDY